jgi:hypothetical protein
MKTIEIKIYSFNELTEEAKQTALNEYRENTHDDFYSYEVTESVKKVIELFNLKTGNYYSDIRTGHIDECILQLAGARLYKYLINNYFTDLFKPEYIKTIDGYKKWQKLYFCKYFTGMNGDRTHIYSKWKKWDNSCTLTGVCYDNDILDPIYEFLKKPTEKTTFQDLMEEIGWNIAKTYDNVEKWVNSEEYITETIEDNEYDFHEDGTRY